MDPFVSEIRILGSNFAPKGWAQCNGQLIPISQNTAVFSLIGTYYGGDGKNTYALPNLQDSVPVHPGQGPGLSLYDLGQQAGTPFVTLLESEIPSHGHAAKVSNQQANVQQPTAATSMARPVGALPFAPSGSATVPMAFQSLGVAGASLPHNNMMPYLVMNYCIALAGVYPPFG
jgi:microcystin-dependent protein